MRNTLKHLGFVLTVKQTNPKSMIVILLFNTRISKF